MKGKALLAIAIAMAATACHNNVPDTPSYLFCGDNQGVIFRGPQISAWYLDRQYPVVSYVTSKGVRGAHLMVPGETCTTLPLSQ
jgi:hypothetical protein